MAFNINLSSDVFLKKKRARYYLPYIPTYSATPCIIRVKIWGLWWWEKRPPLCIIRPQILNVGSVSGHLNVGHRYYRILLMTRRRDTGQIPAYTMLHEGNSGNSTALQNQRAVSAYLCIFIFHGWLGALSQSSMKYSKWHSTSWKAQLELTVVLVV